MEEEQAARLHRLHRAWRLLPQGARRAALLHAAAWLAPRPDQPPPAARAGIAVGGELNQSSGLGEAARLTLGALDALGIACWPAGQGAHPGAPLVLHGNATSLPLYLLRLGRTQLRGRRVIGYWFWDLPTVPESWRRGLALVHEVWVPSRFTAASLQRLAPTVRVVTPPVAARPPAPSGRGRASFGLPDDAFVALTVFNLASSFERKNPLGAIAAHRAAFGTRTDRILLLHVINPHHFPGDFARLQQAVALPNVRLHTTDLSRADLQALMLCADVVLSLHRSEGFGLVPAEAMLLGKPVVATDWSATTEYMDADCAALIPARLIPARDPRGVFAAPGAVWADPDTDAAAAVLARLAEDPGERTRLGAAGQRAARARLGPQTLADAVAALGLAG